MKAFYISMLLFFCCSCKKNSNSEYYKQVDQAVFIYENEYNEKGQLIKRTNLSPSAHLINALKDTYEIYFYDSLNRLIKIERYRYLINENREKRLSEVFILGDTLRKEFRYAEYPTDTFSWSYEKYNAKGDAIESYMKMRVFDDKGKHDIEEYRHIFEYDTVENKVISQSHDLRHETEEKYVVTLKKYTLGDTVITDRFNEINLLTSKQKEFSADKFNITTHIDYENNTVDTLFSVLGKEVRFIKISPIEKTEVVSEYDSLGNVTKMEERVYEIIK